MIFRQNVSCCIIYQTDPLGTIPGGIDTFIRGILGWAPEDISMSVIGFTTDPNSRPIGKWSECSLRGRQFQLLPLFSVEDQGKQRKLPLSVELTIRLMMNKPGKNIDVLEFHRIEPVMPFFFDKRPKNLVVHQNMSSIKDAQSDIRWKHFPWLYFKIESLLLSRISSVFSVREDAVIDYQERYTSMPEKFHFIPTWMDPEIFYPIDIDERFSLRKSLLQRYGIGANDQVLISVGRLDHQKDPLLMLDSFAHLYKKNSKVRLVWVGEGVLRNKVQDRIAELGLNGKVILAGLHSPQKVAELIHASDLFVLSSAYEGMPMCALEALGCGVPVVTTDVGEVKRVVLPGVNGDIVTERTAERLSDSILNCLMNIEKYRGEACVRAVSEYTPEKVLKPFYENYRRLASQKM